MSLVEKIGAVAEGVGVIGKGHTMGGGQSGYRYRSIEDVLPSFQQSCITHGIVLIPEQADATYRDTTSKGGGRMHECVMRVVWHVTDGSESLRFVTWGEALDGSDKASNKAHTAAWKVAILELLAVPTEKADDPDHDRPERGGPVQFDPTDPGTWPDPVPITAAKSVFVEVFGKEEAKVQWVESGWSGPVPRDELAAVL